MLRRTLSLAALAALVAACSNTTAPTPDDGPNTAIAGGYQLLSVNGVSTSRSTPFQYRYRAPGDTLDTYVQIMTGVACVSTDGRFDFLRVMGGEHITAAGVFLEDANSFGGYIDTRGTVAHLSDDSYRWTSGPMQLTARHSHDSLTVTIDAERVTYLLIEAGAGSAMRDNCRAAGFPS